MLLLIFFFQFFQFYQFFQLPTFWTKRTLAP